MSDERVTLWQAVQTAAVVIVLGFFLYSVRAVLNPFLLFLLLWAVLVPFRGRPGYGALLATAAVIMLVWLLATVGTVLAPFVLSVVLAYVLDPLVDRLEARRFPRVAAIAVLALPALGLLAAFVLLALPAAAEQVGEVLRQSPVFFERIADGLEAALARLARVDIPLIDENALLERLRSVDSASVVAFLEERREALVARAWSGVLGLGRGLGAAMTVLGYVVLTPVLTFYLLRDWDRLVAALGDLIPANRRPAIVSFAKEYDHLLSKYLRGQITVAIAIGLITAVGLWVARFPYASTIGLIVAAFSVVPYLGLLLSLVPAVFIALVSGSVMTSLLKVAIVFGAAQGLEGAVISPRIVGDSVGLHPVLVVLALALGGAFFGFVGLLIAVPGAVGIKLLTVRAIASYRASDLYAGAASTDG